ncbi:MAG: hypothetical protein ACI4PC_06345 [Oscillospiraceae bacterium]
MKRALILLLAFLPLAGCEALPFARELEDTMLVQVLGVDWTDGGVTLTAASDPGEGDGDVKTSVLSGSGCNLAEAEAALKGAGEEYVSLTHVTQLVLGADTDLPAVLEAALEEPALGQSATVWLAADGTARELLEGAGGGAKRLSSIELNSGVPSVTVLQSLMRLEENGWVELPVLELEGETLAPAGILRIGEES